MKRLAAWLLLFIPGLTGDLYASNGVLDMRSHPNSDDCCYYVEFYSRVTFPPTGHAFVRWKIVHRKTGRQWADCYGFYPASKWRGVLRPVSGELRNEGDAVKRYIITNSFVVQVDRETFLRSRKVIPLWQNKIYFMFGRNCARFTEDVARTIGLHVPYCQRPLLPALHLQNLKYANSPYTACGRPCYSIP